MQSHSGASPVTHINRLTNVKSTNSSVHRHVFYFPQEHQKHFLSKLYLNSEPKYHIISSISSISSSIMTDRSSASSDASSLLPTIEAFLNADAKEALRMVIEIYNDGIEPDEQLNWENIKGIFDTTEDQACESEVAKAIQKQRKFDKTLVEMNVATAKRTKLLSVPQRAGVVMLGLDYARVINCPYRGKMDLAEKFRESDERSKELKPWR
jgi:hypothetical protein